MTNTYTKLGARIAGNRAFCGYTQRQLAEMVDVHFTYISKIESGATLPSSALLEAIGEVIHIEPIELYILAGRFDNELLHRRAIENSDTAALLLMIENGSLSAQTLATITTLARKLGGRDE